MPSKCTTEPCQSLPHWVSSTSPPLIGNPPNHASQHFYNHSYTTPTAKEYTQQQLSLAISDAIGIHLRDTKKGNLRHATPEKQSEDDDDTNATTISSPPPHTNIFDLHSTSQQPIDPSHDSPSIATLIAAAMPPLPRPNPHSAAQRPVAKLFALDDDILDAHLRHPEFDICNIVAF
jgi:hypothetical protein